jgi:hypothetical protein
MQCISLMHSSILRRIWLNLMTPCLGFLPGSFTVFTFFWFQLFRPEHHWRDFLNAHLVHQNWYRISFILQLNSHKIFKCNLLQFLWNISKYNYRLRFWYTCMFVPFLFLLLHYKGSLMKTIIGKHTCTYTSYWTNLITNNNAYGELNCDKWIGVLNMVTSMSVVYKEFL